MPYNCFIRLRIWDKLDLKRPISSFIVGGFSLISVFSFDLKVSKKVT